MSTATESRLSYASSPESDVEIGGNDSRGPRLLRASSDPSIATTQDNMDRENLTIGDAAPPPPPYTVSYLNKNLFLYRKVFPYVSIISYH